MLSVWYVYCSNQGFNVIHLYTAVALGSLNNITYRIIISPLCVPPQGGNSRPILGTTNFLMLTTQVLRYRNSVVLNVDSD